MKSVKKYLVYFTCAVVFPFVVGYSYNLSGLAYDYTVYKVFIAE